MSTQEGQVGAARGAAPRAPIGGVVAGLVLVGFGVLILPEAFTDVAFDATFIGRPRLAPIVVSLGWLAIALTYLAHQVIAWRMAVGAKVEAVDPDDRTDPSGEAPTGRQWLTPALLVGALLAYVLLLEVLGFVIATATFFVVAARILRSSRLLRDIAVGVPLALGVYLGFTRLLEINLPEGVLPL